MFYDLKLPYREKNASLFIHGFIDKEVYFMLENGLDEMKELFIVNLN